MQATAWLGTTRLAKSDGMRRPVSGRDVRASPVRSACALALRCFTGDSNQGTIRASRASVCASSRSSFFRLSPIRRTLRAWATIASCPNSASSRLTQGECIPVSSATRLRGIPPNLSRRAFGVVLSFCSSTASPRSSSTQYQLERSPRSKPIVSFPIVCFSSEKFLIRWLPTVLIFFIAGLLFICALSTSITWERTPHPAGDRPSNPIC